jgi:hypothetical protein
MKKDKLQRGGAGARVTAQDLPYDTRSKVGTHGDWEFPGLVVAEAVAREIFGWEQTEGFATVSDAYAAVCSHKVAAFWVSSRHNRIDDYLNGGRLRLLDIYPEKTPSVVIAGLVDRLPDKPSAVYFPRDESARVEDIGMLGFGYVQAVMSGVAACRCVLQRRGEAVCITTSVCAAHFELNILQVLEVDPVETFFLFEPMN